MSETRTTKPPRVKNITTETIITEFESLLLIDAGSSGFRLTDEDGNTVTIPTGTPVSISGPAGRISGPITVVAPATGTLNVTAIYFSRLKI